jgi:hypothetical protein
MLDTKTRGSADAALETEASGVSRRGALECMIWAGTGVLWTLSGGVPKSLGLLGDAHAADVPSFTFLQISDSHIGFNKPANPDALGTLREAIAKIKAVPAKPAFMIHTGDITHLSKPDEFDNASQLIGEAALDVHYVPGEHDFVDEGVGKAYLARYGKGTKGQGWYSFDDHGVHFIGLVNVVDLKAGGLGRLGADQLAWLADDLKDKADSTPIVVFAHIPLWTVYAEWGWGTDDGMQALNMLKRFGSPDRAEGRRQHDLPHGAFHLLPAAGPWNGTLARPHDRAGGSAPLDARHHQRRCAGGRQAARHHRHAACELRVGNGRN